MGHVKNTSLLINNLMGMHSGIYSSVTKVQVELMHLGNGKNSN